MKKLAQIIPCLILALAAGAQQPQTQTAPIYPVNAKYANGVAPGYAPTPGSGLALNLGGGTANCAGTIVTYSAGTLTMAASTTNYIYLNTSSSCAPAVKTSAFTSSDIPIAKVVTGPSSITSIDDDRTMFQQPGSSTSSGISSINSQTGPAVTFVGDASILVTPGSPSPNQIQLHATGVGGGGVFPTTTAWVVTSFSGVDDDNDGNSRSLGVPTSVNCVHTTTSTCTLVFPTAHGVAVKGAVDVSGLSSWPVGIIGIVQQAAQNGSFQVDSVPNSTTLTFTTPRTLTYSCGPCTGNVYDATYWAIWQFAAQPNVYGHGTVYQFETTTLGAATNLATWMGSITGTPLMLIDQSGQNDFFGGATAAQVQTYHENLWAAAHTLGMKVIQTTIAPAQYGLTGVGFKAVQVNQWYWDTYALGVTDSQVASGKYIDWYVDVSTPLTVFGNIQKMPNPGANQVFAQELNRAIAAQGGIHYSKPIGTYSGTAPGPDAPTFVLNAGEYNVDQNMNVWRLRQQNGSGWQGDNYYASGNSQIFSLNWLGASNSAHVCNPYNLYSGAGNDHFSFCMGGDFTTSANNYMALAGPSDSDVFRWYADYHIRLPHLTASSGNQPLQVNTNGDVSVGSSGGSCGTGNIPCTNTSNLFNGGTQTAQSNTYNVTPLITKGNVSGVVMPTIVQSTLSGSAVTWNVAAGTTLVMIAFGGSGGGGKGQSSGDTWTTLFTGANDGLVSYAYNVTGSASKIISNPDNSPFILYNLSNVASGNPLDLQVHATATGTTTPNISITTTAINDLMIGGLTQHGDTYNSASPVSWTNLLSYFGNMNSLTSAAATTIGTYPLTISKSGPDTTTIFILAFKGASGLTQSADLQQFQDPSGNELSAVDNLGNFRGAHGSNEVVTFSATPTFSIAVRSSQITMTANITSFTLASGIDGQEKTLCFIQDATGSRTVVAPANVHGFFTVGTTASKANCQHFTFLNSLSAWFADSAGVTNQ